MRSLSLLSLILTAAPTAFGALRGSSNADVSLSSIITSSWSSHKSFAPVCMKDASATISIEDLQQVMYSVRDEINSILSSMTEDEQAQLYATAFRLIFHDAAEADLRTEDGYGPDGCLSYSSGNADLVSPTSIVNTVIEPMWQKYCDKMSRADFWVLFAKLALEKADGSHSLNLPFQYGRKDAKECGVSSSRLMDNQRGEDDFFRVFLQQMQLSVNDAVALMGARSVGFHTRSEYSWDATPSVLDNGYFKLLGKSSWKNVFDKSDSSMHMWIQVESATASAPATEVVSTTIAESVPVDAQTDSTTSTGSIVDSVIEIFRRRTQEDVPISNPSDFVPVASSVAMLNTDMALAFPIHTEFSFYYRSYVSREDDMCGPTMVTGGTEHGCVGGGEETVGWPYYTFDQVQRYADSNSAFIWDFAGAFERMTTVGYNVAGRVIEEGKFGTLIPMQSISNAL